MEKRFCPLCQKDNLKSKVYIGPESVKTTKIKREVPFYDEDGDYHFHDNLIHIQYYTCSNGHTWNEKKYNKCPKIGCSWKQEQE